MLDPDKMDDLDDLRAFVDFPKGAISPPLDPNDFPVPPGWTPPPPIDLTATVKPFPKVIPPALPFDLDPIIHASDWIKAAMGEIEDNEEHAREAKAAADLYDAEAKKLTDAIEAGNISDEFALSVESYGIRAARRREAAAVAIGKSLKLCQDMAMIAVEQRAAVAGVAAILKKVNGLSVRDAFTSAWEIRGICRAAIVEMNEEGVSLRRRVGAVISETSGRRVTDDHKLPRMGTTVLIRIGADGRGMSLIFAMAAGIDNEGGEAMRIHYAPPRVVGKDGSEGIGK